MADPREELRQVKDDLDQLEVQLDSLLQRQSQLLQKREQLEQLIKDEARREASKDWDRTDFAWSPKLKDTLHSVFHIQGFRPLQLKTMNVTLSGKDCILIMPTGGGKSLCFQLPALVSKGITLVVSPLISLMEDQVLALNKLDVPAVKLTAASTKEQVKHVQDNMTNQKCPFRMLYVTPEKLAKSKRFMNRLEKMYDAGLFSRIVIDEVHCCSQWGHDFRPDYKFLGVLRRQFPGVPILGLTATATNNVLQDVKKMLGVHDCVVYRASFNRTNLFYEVRIKPSSASATLDDIHKVISSRFKGQSGIVYCLSQKDTENVARELSQRGIKSDCYHANLDPQYRSRTHTRWIDNQIQVVVATIAFGMGIDKPDVRFVIHHSISKSMENYYQESGRAGRDDERSYCILYVGFSDVSRQSTMVFTEQTGLDKLYNMVDYAFDASKCRRTLIARHFGERWDSADCNMMCDHCNKGPGAAQFSPVAVTSACHHVLAVLDQAKHKDQRITALKLLEASLGRGPHKVKASSLGGISDVSAERLLIHLLLRGYLREDFHFTAYTTISYLLPGPMAAKLRDPNHSVTLDLEVNETTEKPRKKSSSATSAAKATVIKGKKKPVIVNVENSKFIEGGRGTKTEESKTKKSAKKRKVQRVVDSDDDFDFGDVGDMPISDKQKRQLTTGAKKHRRDCILIQDSDDDDDPTPGTSGGSKRTHSEVSSAANGQVSSGADSVLSLNEEEDIGSVYSRQLAAAEGNLSSPEAADDRRDTDKSWTVSDEDSS